MADFEQQHINNVAAQQLEVYNIYLKIIADLTLAASRIDFNGNKVQKLKDYPVLYNQLVSLVAGFDSDFQKSVIAGITTAFEQSQTKNDLLVRQTMGSILLMHPAIAAAMNISTQGAVAAFANRVEAGLNLSDRIYQMGVQLQNELEQSLLIQIKTGMSAKKATAMIKQFLLEPDKLFRRVNQLQADGTTKLVLSKAAKAYKPGAGVYRSSYKNALRLTRTETNIAYRTADFARWQKLPFVTGIEIRTSDNHPKLDECDELAGVYPKEFQFSGWHPQCLCYQIPILATDDEQNYIEDQLLALKPVDTDQINYVSSIPGSAQNYIDTNAERISKFQSTPYWVKDNFKNGDIKKGLDL